MNAVIYCRVSHEKQIRDRDYTSLDVQREDCLRYLVDEFPDAHLLEVVEETESAGNPNCPGLTRIVQLVEARAVDLLIVYMWISTGARLRGTACICAGCANSVASASAGERGDGQHLLAAVGK